MYYVILGRISVCWPQSIQRYSSPLIKSVSLISISYLNLLWFVSDAVTAYTTQSLNVVAKQTSERERIGTLCLRTNQPIKVLGAVFRPCCLVVYAAITSSFHTSHTLRLQTNGTNNGAGTTSILVLKGHSLLRARATARHASESLLENHNPTRTQKYH